MKISESQTTVDHPYTIWKLEPLSYRESRGGLSHLLHRRFLRITRPT